MTFAFVLDTVSAPSLERGPAALARPPFADDASAWSRALAQAEAIHAAMPFAASVTRVPWFGELPEGSRTELESRLARERMLLAMLDHELESALGALERARIPVVLVKGMDLGRRFYPNRLGRPMADADILVPDECFEGARATLGAEGFARVGDDYPGRIRIELSRGPRAPVVELHRRLLADSTPEETSMFWRRATPMRYADLAHPARVLSTEDYIEYLIRHCAIQHLAETPTWMNDLYFLLRGSATAPDWDRIVTALRAKRASAGAWFALRLLGRWGAPVPPSAIEALERSVGPVRRAILGARARPEAWYSPEPRSLAWVVSSRFLLRESAWQALRYGISRELHALRAR